MTRDIHLWGKESAKCTLRGHSNEPQDDDTTLV